MLQLVNGPTAEPLSLDELKLHLRIDGRDEDALIGGLLTTARHEIERECGRALLGQTWDLWLDAWPGSILDVPLPRLQSVASITYYDTANQPHTVDASTYFVDTASEPGRIALAYGQSWPAVTLRPINGLCIRFTAGYTSVADVPAKLLAAIKLLVGWLYENRGDGAAIGAGQAPTLWPDAVHRLCDQYSVRLGFA